MKNYEHLERQDGYLRTQLGESLKNKKKALQSDAAISSGHPHQSLKAKRTLFGSCSEDDPEPRARRGRRHHHHQSSHDIKIEVPAFEGLILMSFLSGCIQLRAQFKKVPGHKKAKARGAHRCTSKGVRRRPFQKLRQACAFLGFKKGRNGSEGCTLWILDKISLKFMKTRTITCVLGKKIIICA